MPRDSQRLVLGMNRGVEDRFPQQLDISLPR